MLTIGQSETPGGLSTLSSWWSIRPIWKQHHRLEVRRESLVPSAGKAVSSRFSVAPSSLTWRKRDKDFQHQDMCISPLHTGRSGAQMHSRGPLPPCVPWIPNGNRTVRQLLAILLEQRPTLPAHGHGCLNLHPSILAPDGNTHSLLERVTGSVFLRKQMQT